MYFYRQPSLDEFSEKYSQRKMETLKSYLIQAAGRPNFQKIVNVLSTIYEKGYLKKILWEDQNEKNS